MKATHVLIWESFIIQAKATGQKSSRLQVTSTHAFRNIWYNIYEMKKSAVDLLKRSDWEDLVDIRHGDIIACLVDGELVEGVVHIAPKDLSVMLYGREIQLRSSSHIMMMAPRIYTEDPWNGSGANEFGKQRLKELLIGLYHDYRIISENREGVLSLIPAFRARRVPHDISLANLHKRKNSLKMSLKTGQLSTKGYIQELEKVRVRIQEEKTLLRKGFQDVFSPLLSECVHCNNLMEVIERLGPAH